MKRIWKIGLVILGLIAMGILWFVLTPVDIRPAYVKDDISDEDYAKGAALLNEMQEAYGGMNHWLSYETGTYAQVADWYDDKLGVAGWDELPQQFEMTAILGTDNCEFTLLNGENKGQVWGVEDWKSYQLKRGQKHFVHNEKYHHKLIYKNYWFQFPFRVSEAPIIAYGGKGIVKGEEYDLLYITWGSVSANKEFDQYVLYLDKETRMIEWLNFTLREKFNFLKITARFADFKSIGGIMSPFSQYITVGAPEAGGPQMHENRYQWIQFGEERVMR